MTTVTDVSGIDSPMMVEIKYKLAHCTGTENYHRDGAGLLYTDGVKQLADLAGAYWLISDISVVSQMKFPRVPFQLWKIRVKDMIGEITMQEDSDAPVKYRQKYEYTDFPDGEMKLYVCDGVMLLPSEY